MPIAVPVGIELTDGERVQLESWARRRTSAQALALRSRIVLLAADGRNNTEIAERLGVHRPMVRKWRGRFAEQRLDGLTDEPRPGRPRTVTDAQVEEVIVKTLETTPTDATHWSTRSMGREVGLTQSAVLRIWQAFGLQPHRQQTWKLSRDPQFIDKVRDVVGIYLNPPERAVVLCVDEKSQIQALDRTAPILPMLPGTPSAPPTTTSAPAPRASTPRWTSPPARSSADFTAATARSSSSSSCRHSIARSRPASTSISSSTTARPTRHPRSSAGSAPTRGSSCTSPRRRARG